MTWFLKVDDVTVKYEDFVALDSVSIEISKGDFIGLLGSNGAGKSTFINTIVGLQPMYRGSVEYNETELSNKQQPFSNIGFNPQTAVMDFYTTVKDNVILGLNLAGIFGSKADELCMQALDVLNLSDKKINWLIPYQGDSYNVFSLPELLHINQIFTFWMSRQ